MKQLGRPGEGNSSGVHKEKKGQIMQHDNKKESTDGREEDTREMWGWGST